MFEELEKTVLNILVTFMLINLFGSIVSIVAFLAPLGENYCCQVQFAMSDKIESHIFFHFHSPRCQWQDSSLESQDNESSVLPLCYQEPKIYDFLRP
jgi:hypothetical protein